MFYIEIFFSFLVTVGFAILFNVRGKFIIYSGVGGAISWFFYLIFKEQGYQVSSCYLLATLITSLYCEIVARKIKTTVPTLLIAALIPLAPGGGIYYTMLHLLNNQYKLSLLKGAETLVLAGAMALGVIIGMSFSKIFFRLKKI